MRPQPPRCEEVEADDAARVTKYKFNFALATAQEHLDAASAAEQEDEARRRRSSISTWRMASIESTSRSSKRCAPCSACSISALPSSRKCPGGRRRARRHENSATSNDENVIDAVHALSCASSASAYAAVGAATKLITGDCAIFGKLSPVPAAPMTAAEKERRRAIGHPVGILRRGRRVEPSVESGRQRSRADALRRRFGSLLVR